MNDETLNVQLGWADLLSSGNLVRSLALSGGVALHAINLYISTTILPSIVQDIGGIDYYAWNTTLFVVASILGAALSSRLLATTGPRAGYAVAALVFVAGCLLCAIAPAMTVMLAGRFVQGLGGGMLLALPYAMIRRVFAEPLWPRAMALLSSMWGIATLLGPAVGGAFAEYGVWRGAFWSLIPAAVAFTVAAALILPSDPDKQDGHSELPLPQLALLLVAVVAASWGSLGTDIWLTALGLALAFVLVIGIIALEKSSPRRILPRGTFTAGSPLGALYAMSALLAVTVTCTEIFLPLFLQDLHGRSPLQAGYIAAIMSAGWTAGAIYTSGLQGYNRSLALRAAPVLSFAAMLALAILMPWQDGHGGGLSLSLIAAALIVGGVGVGLAYPHLAARVLTVAPPEEADNAASAVMTVQLCATALGAALAGLTVNLAGRTGAGIEMDTVRASRWLFAVVAVAPVLFLVLLRRERSGEKL